MAKTKAELEKEFEAYKKEAESAVERFKKRMLHTERQLEERDKAYNALHKKFDSLGKDYVDLKEKYDDLQTQNLRKEPAFMDERCKLLEEENKELHKTNRDLCDRCLNCENYKNAAEQIAVNRKLEREIEELKEMLDKINKDYMDLSLEYNNLELTIENKNEAYKKLEKSCIKYQSQIKESEEDYESLNKEFYDLLEKYEELVTAHSNMSKRYGCLVCDNEYLKRENKDLKKELEEEKAKSKFIPLPPRPDYPALLKRYTDLQKDHEQLDKDFKDLYGRYEEQKKRIAELVSIVDDKYDTIWNLKTKLSEHENELRSLEHSFNIKAENIYDILNAWFAVSEKLEIVTPILYADNLKYEMPDYIAMVGRVHSKNDPKEYEIVKKAMGIKSCQSK